MLVLVLSIGITIGLSLNVSAQTPPIPSWIKNVALWWGQGNTSDEEFIQAIQWLVDNKIIVLPTSQQPTLQTPSSSITQSFASGITNMICNRDAIGSIHITGNFSSNTSYSFVDLRGAILDNNGNVLATHTTTIEKVQPSTPQIFDILISYPGNFVKCKVQVDSTTP